MMCVYMCHCIYCHICVLIYYMLYIYAYYMPGDISHILFCLIYYMPAYMPIYSPPCIIDGVVYMYYMCMYIILYVCSWAKEINRIYVYDIPSYSDI